MSHEITATDGIVYAVGSEKPWHGLGTEVDPNLNAIEVMNAAGLGWNVEKRPVLYSTKDGVSTIPGQVAIVRSDNEDVLGITTNRYSPLTNTEGFSAFQPILDTGLAKIETAGSLKGGKIVWALARMQEEQLTVSEQDKITPYILLSFGHDGLRAIRGGFTPVRVVCWNTLTSAENSASSKLLRVFHRGDVKSHLDKVVEAMDLAMQEFRTTTEQYKKMLNTSISLADIRNYVKVVLDLEESTTNKRATNLINKVTALAENGIGSELASGTVWGAYNAITQHLSHEAGRNADNRYASLWFGQGADVNRRAFNEALKLAA